MPDRSPVRSYRTDFQRDETPISEGGMWINGRADGIAWTDVVTSNGIAHGARSRMEVAEQRVEQGNLENPEAGPLGDYDDPTAVLAGSWGPNQHGTDTVFVRNPTAEFFQEVEIRLRTVVEPNRCTGYEVFWRCLKTDEAYAEIVRWNGPIGDCTTLERLAGAECGVKHGDVVEATIEGNVLRSFVNGVEIMSVTDDVYTAGSPGIGFNFGVGDTNADHGFTSFVIDTYDA